MNSEKKRSYRSTAECNTNSQSPQGNKYSFYCFTHFYIENYDDFENRLKGHCKKYYFGKEICPNTGRKHLQGFLHLNFRMRLTEIKNRICNKTHFEPCKGNAMTNMEYCGKDKDITKFGYHEEYKLKLDSLYKWEEWIINEILNKEPDDRLIYWIWGSNGCNGKSTFTKYIISNYEKSIILSGKSNDMKNGIIQYKKTNNYLPKIIIIDIPRSIDNDFISYSGIEEIKNMCFFCGKYEGGMICGSSPHVIIFSNESPNQTKFSKDRWIIKNIENNE